MITLITGYMGSGKTARLIELAEQVPAENRLVLANKKHDGYFVPTQYIESRNNKRIQCTNALFSERMLIEIKDSVTHIFIDEGQWVNKDRPTYAKLLSDKGIVIYVSLLDRDYTGREFDMYKKWAEVADKIEHLHAICDATNRDAHFSELLTDHESIQKEDYRAVCWDVFKQSKHCKI